MNFQMSVPEQIAYSVAFTDHCTYWVRTWEWHELEHRHEYNCLADMHTKLTGSIDKDLGLKYTKEDMITKNSTFKTF